MYVYIYLYIYIIFILWESSLAYHHPEELALPSFDSATWWSAAEDDRKERREQRRGGALAASFVNEFAEAKTVALHVMIPR